MIKYLTTQEILEATDGHLIKGSLDLLFKGVSVDSRQISSGELFVALPGSRFDGHDFVKKAWAAGALGAIISHSFPGEKELLKSGEEFCLFKVEDTLKALGDIASKLRESFSGPVIGITGSCGKTTTKEFISTLLSRRWKVAKNPGNFNNLIGLPLSLINAPEDTEALVLEMASNQPGEIARLAKILKPQVSVVVSVYPAHLKGLGSLEGVVKEKLSLFLETPESTWIYPYDQEIVRRKVEVFKTSGQTLSFGFKKGADLRARGISITLKGTRFILSYKGKEEQAFLPLLGRHFVWDALAAVATCLALDFSWSEILEGLSQLRTLSGRMQVCSLRNSLILDDTYNANPGSLAAACDLVRELSENSFFKIAVIGDMKELGSQAPHLHKKAGQILGETFDLIFLIGDYAFKIREGLKDPHKAQIFEDKKALVRKLVSYLSKKKSLVLIKGSRAMKMEEIIKALKEAFF